MARFKKGEGGRPKGSQNKVTGAFKEAVLRCYTGIGGDTSFQAWAKKNPTEFYKIAARLIPTEVVGSDAGPVKLEIELTDTAQTQASPDAESAVS